MDLELIKRNTEEIVTEEDLISLIKTKSKPTAYAGYEPSGKIHLGHLITVNKLLDLQKAGFEITVLLADLHAYLNDKGTMAEIKEIAEYNKRCFIALGLDEVKTKFVLGSTFQLGSDYMLNVLKLSQLTTLTRARRSMDEVGRNAENPKVSQMVYPLMQAVDIAMLNVDVAVGGIDQRKIHMLAREGLTTLGFTAPVCIHTPILNGLDGEKMSSSKNNYISVDDTKKAISKKINSAFCTAGEIEKNPVLDIVKYHIMPRYERIVFSRPEKFGGNLEYGSYKEIETAFISGELHPMDLKMGVVSYLDEILEPVRNALVNTTN